jgi:hypothetical protein
MAPASEDHRSPARLWTLGIQLALAIGLAIFLWRGDWENVFLTILVIGLTLLPALVRKRHKIIIPPDFQLVATLFVFLTLFLGSAVDLYYHFWWWDMLLHAGSGFLFGIVGFLAIFLLNQTIACRRRCGRRSSACSRSPSPSPSAWCGRCSSTASICSGRTST